MKQHSNIILTFLLMATTVISCGPSNKITVSNVNDYNSLQNASLLYALPLTVFDISVTAEEVITIPGPYAAFADKYLGINNVPKSTGQSWHITSINVSHHIEADPDFLFVIRNVPGSENSDKLHKLIADSCILDLNVFTVNRTQHYSIPYDPNEVLFTDLSVKRNFDSEGKKEISLLLPDTNYTARMASSKGISEKTTEQKAEEAANFLIKLRKRRFKLVAGQYDFMPEGLAMAEALKELERIEKNYLELFIGKHITKAYAEHYTYTPTPLKEIDRPVVLRFSEKNGFHSAREASGIPVVLEVESANKLKGLKTANASVKPGNNIISYRLPDQVAVKLTVGEQTWAEAVCPVYQSGVMVSVDLNNMIK